MDSFNIIITHTLNDGAATGYREDTSSLTRGMMRNRAVALAIENGRLAHEASKADWEEAKRELTGSAAK